MKLTPLEICVLDDAEIIRFPAKKYSMHRGMHIMFTSTTQELKSKMSFNVPDCVVLNNIVSETEFYFLVKDLRSDELTKSIPIVVLDSGGSNHDRTKWYDIGCDAYLTVPFYPEELYSIIRSLLKSRRPPTLFILESCALIREVESLLIEKISSYTYPGTKLYFTRQEASVLGKIVDGKTVAEVQEELGTSKRNIEKYLTRLYDKSRTKGMSELKFLPWDSVLGSLKANDGD